LAGDKRGNHPKDHEKRGGLVLQGLRPKKEREKVGGAWETEVYELKKSQTCHKPNKGGGGAEERKIKKESNRGEGIIKWQIAQIATKGG